MWIPQIKLCRTSPLGFQSVNEGPHCSMTGSATINKERFIYYEIPKSAKMALAKP